MASNAAATHNLQRQALLQSADAYLYAVGMDVDAATALSALGGKRSTKAFNAPMRFPSITTSYASIREWSIAPNLGGGHQA